MNDSGLTGGTEPWSLRALLAYVDAVHEAGRSAILGDAGGFAGPGNWWSGFDARLGAAAGPRYDWQGLLRRDFDDGIVLVREPGAKLVTVQLPDTYTRLDGSAVTSIALAACGKSASVAN